MRDSVQHDMKLKLNGFAAGIISLVCKVATNKWCCCCQELSKEMSLFTASDEI